MAAELVQVPIDKCVADDEFNTRKRGSGDLTNLIESIKAIGIKEPLLGKDKENKEDQVEIFAGFRRLAAAKEAGLTTVPVLVHKRREVTKKDMLLFNITENIQREDLNPIDEAFAMQRLQIDHQMATEDICAKLGLKKSHVEARFRLLKLHAVVLDAVHDSRITVTAALEIDRLPVEKQPKFVDIAEEMSGTKLAQLINKELEKLQRKIEGTEKKEKTTDSSSAAMIENIKLIRKASMVVCDGIGYDEEGKSKVKSVSYKVLDPDDVSVLAKFYDDLADLVPSDIEINEKAKEEVVALVESAGEVQNKMYCTDSPAFRQAMLKVITDRAQEIAEEAAKTTGKRAKVTYAIMREASDEFFVEYEAMEEDSE